SSGNVGIGTTSPWGLLSVNPNGIAGPAFVVGSSTQCVTGDTKLRRRRSRRRADGKEEEYFEDVRIDEIKAGDEILTLDQKSGTFVVSRVKQLMPMGTKDIFELVTATGKKIRTTGNHPYLVAPKGIEKTKNPDLIAAFIDFANIKAGYRDRGYRSIDLKVLHSALHNAGVSTTRFYYGTDERNEKQTSFFAKIASFGYVVVSKSVQYFNISFISLLEKPFNRRWIEALPASLRENLMHEAERLDRIGIQLLQPKANFDVEITTDALRLAETHQHFILFSGDGDFVPLARRLRELGKKVTVVSDRKYLSGELLLAADKFVTLGLLNKFVPGLLLGDAVTQNPPRGRVLKKGTASIADLLGLSSIPVDNREHSFVKGGSWKKVVDIREGQMIATKGANGKPVYERVVAVNRLPAEQVWDIEVEGTHNFIGNGIVAHNTAFLVSNDGNVGIGTTSPSAGFAVHGTSYVSGTSFFGGALTATSTLNVTGLSTLGNASTT
ncbi:MAG: NYN domain-containing protein, partial [Patescibacteria group bacterium]